MKRRLALLPWPLLLAAAATAQTAEGQARLAFGPDGQADSARIECVDGRATLFLWVRQAPRGAAGGEFTTTLRVYQGRNSVGLPAAGKAEGQPPFRLAAPLADPVAFLDGVRRNQRLTVVSYAGRATQPAPDAAATAAFLAACTTRR